MDLDMADIPDFIAQFKTRFKECATGDEILELVQTMCTDELFREHPECFSSAEHHVLKHLQQWYFDAEDAQDSQASEEQKSISLFYARILYHFCKTANYECESEQYIVAAMPGTPKLYLDQCGSLEEMFEALKHTGIIYLFQELSKGRYSALAKDIDTRYIIQAIPTYIPYLRYNMAFITTEDFGGFGAVVTAISNYLDSDSPDNETLMAASYILQLHGMQTGDAEQELSKCNTDNDRYVFNDYLRDRLLTSLSKHMDIRELRNLLSCRDLFESENIVSFEKWKLLLSNDCNIGDSALDLTL